MKQHDIFIKKKKKKSKKSLWNKLPLQGNLKRERKKMSNDNKKKKRTYFQHTVCPSFSRLRLSKPTIHATRLARIIWAGSSGSAVL